MDDITWGVAAAATQAEGAAPASDWRAWEAEGRVPYSSDGNGFATNYRQDLRLFSEAGFSAVRLTIDWARIEPIVDVVDDRAVDHYRDVLSSAVEAGLAPWLVLVDGSLPGWFSIDERGFREQRARSYYWPRHAERCAELFGTWAAAWIPILRPLRLARRAYFSASAPPGLHHPERFALTLEGLYLGLGDAWRALRGGPPVVAAFDVAVVHPADREVTTRGEARRGNELLWSWTSLFRDGETSIPGLGPAASPILRDAFDLVGLTIEQRITVDEQGKWWRSPHAADVAELLHRAGEDASERPLAVLGQTVANPDEAEEVPALVEAAAAEGVPVRAWFHEPAIDGYEGIQGFDAELGLWDRDRNPKAILHPIAERAAASRVRFEPDWSTAVSLEPPRRTAG